MSEITAAIGEIQAGRLDEILQKRRRVACAYDEALGRIDGVHLPPMAGRDRASWFVYVIRLAEDFTEARRDAIMAGLSERGIGCANYFVPVHTQPYVMEALGTGPGDFPITERVAARTIALPFYCDLGQAEISRVAAALKEALASSRRGA